MGNQVSGSSPIIKLFSPSLVADIVENKIRGEEYFSTGLEISPSEMTLNRHTSSESKYSDTRVNSYLVEQMWWRGFRKCATNEKNIKSSGDNSFRCISSKEDKQYILRLGNRASYDYIQGYLDLNK